MQVNDPPVPRRRCSSRWRAGERVQPGIAARLPRKTTAAGALVRNSEGLILFLEAVYKPTLEIPGGVTEFDESPLESVRREAREEIGIDI
ncbi:NUDIX domain-containing protein [Kribbella sp. NPDC056345]|uniref:NUDIX domain-containing protein n=1 Tax=Kribbella sp. NPDC056345 TaxID=3345789 RepID=UPI0035D92617